MKVLISHAVEDEPAATALKELIRRCSLNRVDVWFSSDRSALGGMPIGGPWFSELHDKLKTTDWIVAIVTAQSLSSPWLYFECGFGACSRTNCVIPITIGMPESSVPMPLAAYQIYDCANATSLATFVQKLLAADSIPYDEEMTKSVRDNTQRRMIEHHKNAAAAHESPDTTSSQSRADVAALKSFIEQRFVELYEMLPLDRRPVVSLELSFDASELNVTEPPFVLNIPSGASVLDVLNEIYFRMEKYIEPFTYLSEWVIVDMTDNDIDLFYREMAERVPAHVVFSSERKYKLRRIPNSERSILPSGDRTRHR